MGKRPPSSATARKSKRCPNPAPRGSKSTRAASFAPAQKCPHSTAASSPHAPARRPKRPHHRQPSPVFSTSPSRTTTSPHPARLSRPWSSMKRTKSRMSPANTRRAGEQLRSGAAAAIIARISRQKQFGSPGTGPHHERLEGLAELFLLENRENRGSNQV